MEKIFTNEMYKNSSLPAKICCLYHKKNAFLKYQNICHLQLNATLRIDTYRIVVSTTSYSQSAVLHSPS